MSRGKLVDYFQGVSAKQLTAVDTNPKRSNQHEVGTTSRMRTDFLGEQHQQRFNTTYIWLSDDEDPVRIDGSSTHYDSRIKAPHRKPEWRLYYNSNTVTQKMSEGDTLFLALDRLGKLYFIVTPPGSTYESQIGWMFNLPSVSGRFISRPVSKDDRDIDFSTRYILEELGIELQELKNYHLDSIVGQFGTTFPSTSEFSRLARSSLPDISPTDDPDAALIAWLEHEEDLFRRLEHRIVSERLAQGFMQDGTADVDGFIKYSLAVQNRRKARMGQSLENHIAAILDARKIRYDRGAVTELNSKPDFLFPGKEAYSRAPTGDESLAMLAAKSSCKDRWRQVLAEAEKIPIKHLLTLEPGISHKQTDQMKAHKVQLVIPDAIQTTYSESQAEHLMSVTNFVEYIADLQRQIASPR